MDLLFYYKWKKLKADEARSDRTATFNSDSPHLHGANVGDSIWVIVWKSGAEDYRLVRHIVVQGKSMNAQGTANAKYGAYCVSVNTDESLHYEDYETDLSVSAIVERELGKKPRGQSFQGDNHVGALNRDQSGLFRKFAAKLAGRKRPF